MLIDYFKQYMKVSRNISNISVEKYVNAIYSINRLLNLYNYPIKDVFDVSSIDELSGIRDFLNTNAEFLSRDEIGHRMYSVAFNHFYRFVAEDNLFFSNSITDMDIAVEIPRQSNRINSAWQRNQILISQTIEGSHYLCEHNNSHETFISRKTGKPYMEGHHLIPLKYQQYFDYGLDVYANIICVCPICHRLLHYGTDKERSYVAEELFDMRSDRLQKSGIDISKLDFIELII